MCVGLRFCDDHFNPVCGYALCNLQWERQVKNNIIVHYTMEREGISTASEVACHRCVLDCKNQTLHLWDASGVEDIYYHITSATVRSVG